VIHLEESACTAPTCIMQYACHCVLKLPGGDEAQKVLLCTSMSTCILLAYALSVGQMSADAVTGIRG
jgi:hypothetical protein